MTSAPPHPTPTPEVSSYPNYAQGRARLRNFLRRGRKAYIRTKRYAYYRYSDTLDIIVIRIVPAIYEVRAYPVSALMVGSVEEALTIQPFRAWLFARNHHTGAIYYITGSQRAGIENYKKVRAIIRRAGTLATASFHQPVTA
ncbi:hypothetical protein ES703_70978 [subsurface metagenome]